MLHVRISGLPRSGMIDATECRELAAECRQMADRAQTFRMRSILIDLVRTWDRLALEVEHGKDHPQAGAATSLMRSSHANKSETLQQIESGQRGRRVDHRADPARLGVERIFTGHESFLSDPHRRAANRRVVHCLRIRMAAGSFYRHNISRSTRCTFVAETRQYFALVPRLFAQPIVRALVSRARPSDLSCPPESHD